MKTKNILYGSIASLMLGIGATGCSDDNMLGDNGGDFVTFSVNLDDAATTRALGDGQSVTKLFYAVYDTNGALVYNNTKSVSTYPTTVDLTLTKGITYDVVFFAYNGSSSPYTIDKATGELTVNYSKINGSSSYLSKDYDCFHYVRKGFVAGSSAQENVTMRRPVAQVNFGTNDFQDFCKLVNTTESSVYFNISTKAATKFNLLNGETSDEQEISTTLLRYFGYYRSENCAGEFPVPGYTYLSATYFFTDGSNRDVKMNVYGDDRGNTLYKSVEVPNMPNKTNYRTNVYGSLLTTSKSFKVEIEPIFEGYSDIWTGDATDPVQNTDGTWSITTPAQLAGLAKMVNAGKDFAGETVNLERDLDLANINWTPIGTWNHPFNGEFNGNNHTISNLKVVMSGNYNPAGLFGAIKRNGGNKGHIHDFTIDGAYISNIKDANPDNGYGSGVALGQNFTGDAVENITVKNATIEAYHWAGGIVGYSYASIKNNKAENITINLKTCNVNNKVDFADKAGGIIGYMGEGSSYEVSGNTVSNVNITGYRHIGGIAGYIHYGNKVSNNSVNGGTITQDLSQNYKNINSGDLIGKIFGYVNENAQDLGGNTEQNVELVLSSVVDNEAALTSALANGGYIVLGKDMNLTSVSGKITLTKPTTINLGGHKVSMQGDALQTSSELTIDGEGIIESTGRAIVGLEGSTIIVNGGEIKTSALVGQIPAILAYGNLEVNGGKFVSQQGKCVILNWPNYSHGEKLRAVINGGEFTASVNYALFISGSSNKADRYVEINGGTFTGNAGVQVEGLTKVVINDGMFIQNSTNSTGHALCAGADDSSYTNYPNGIGSDVTVNGGYFYGAPGYALCQAGKSRITVNRAYVNKLTGGFTIGLNRSAETLATPVNKTLNGKTFEFSYRIK
ncbi:MAG: hypothetical protein NC204_06985 [Candidatus Amulumruptor caecigallinarius]|nr:hypothetical protein [Candidatus Amulumruptor caecigallinarius]